MPASDGARFNASVARALPCSRSRHPVKYLPGHFVCLLLVCAPVCACVRVFLCAWARPSVDASTLAPRPCRASPLHPFYFHGAIAAVTASLAMNLATAFLCVRPAIRQSAAGRRDTILTVLFNTMFLINGQSQVGCALFAPVLQAVVFFERLFGAYLPGCSKEKNPPPITKPGVGIIVPKTSSKSDIFDKYLSKCMSLVGILFDFGGLVWFNF